MRMVNNTQHSTRRLNAKEIKTFTINPPSASWQEKFSQSGWGFYLDKLLVKYSLSHKVRCNIPY